MLKLISLFHFMGFNTATRKILITCVACTCGDLGPFLLFFTHKGRKPPPLSGSLSVNKALNRDSTSHPQFLGLWGSRKVSVDLFSGWQYQLNKSLVLGWMIGDPSSSYTCPVDMQTLLKTQKGILLVSWSFCDK